MTHSVQNNVLPKIWLSQKIKVQKTEFGAIIGLWINIIVLLNGSSIFLTFLSLKRITCWHFYRWNYRKRNKVHCNSEVYLPVYDSLLYSAASLLKDLEPSKCCQQQKLPWHLQMVAMLEFLIYFHLRNLISLLWQPTPSSDHEQQQIPLHDPPKTQNKKNELE